MTTTWTISTGAPTVVLDGVTPGATVRYEVVGLGLVDAERLLGAAGLHRGVVRHLHQPDVATGSRLDLRGTS